MRWLALPSLLLGLAVTSSAQDVWIVKQGGGPGVDFIEISQAVAAASDGDVILVRNGTYASFAVYGKSLTITADRGASPAVSMYSSTLAAVANLAGDQEVYLRGLHFAGSFFHFSEPYPKPALLVQSCQGEVWVEDCVFDGAIGFSLSTAVEAIDAAGVNLVRCDVSCTVAHEGVYGSAVRATDSNVAVFDSTLRGGPGTAPYIQSSNGAGHGIRISGGSLFVAGSTLQGGDGTTQCCGIGGNDGGDGLHVEGGAVTYLRDTVEIPGQGGPSGGSGPAGSPGTEVEVLSGSATFVVSDARSLVIESPVRAGIDRVVHRYTGNPGDVVYVMYSTGQAPGAYVPTWHGAMVLDFSRVFGHVVGTIDASGVLVTTTEAPTVATAQLVQLTAQASFVNGVLGGNLSSPSTLVVLPELTRPAFRER